MNRSYPYDWVDAFADRPFGGNGCAVVYDDGLLDDQTCLNFTRETGLVECTFIAPSDVADAKIRYFLAAREIPFAGHPTIASVASLIDRGKITADQLRVETGAGVMDITVDRSGPLPLITMTQNAPEFGQDVAPDLVAGVVGLTADDIVGTPQVVSTGLPFCVTVLKSHDALRRAVLDIDALARFRVQITHKDANVMEPYLITTQGATSAGDTFARLLLAPPNPAEDPFTGSATGCAAAYLWKNGLISRPDYIAEQGHWMERPGQAQVTVLDKPDAISGVQVAGTGVIVMRGQVLV